MPLKGYDELPKDLKNLIGGLLSEQDKKSLAIAQQFSAPIQRMIDCVKELVADLDLLRELRDGYYDQRKALKATKLAALEKDSKLKKAFDAMDKPAKKELLDTLGDEFEKGQLAALKKGIAGLDKEISRLNVLCKEASGVLAALKDQQKIFATL